MASQDQRVARRPPALDIPTGWPGLFSAAPGRPCASSSYFTQEALISRVSMRHLKSFGRRLLLCMYVPWLKVVELLTGPGLYYVRTGASEKALLAKLTSPTVHLQQCPARDLGNKSGSQDLGGRRTRRCSRMSIGAATATFTPFRTTALAWLWTSVLVILLRPKSPWPERVMPAAR